MRTWHFIAALLLGLLVTRAWGDDLQDGIAALNRKDYASAVRRLEPLAQAGNAQAQWRLGLLYFHGHGVPESDAQALQWFERAARQGNADGQYHVGNMYAYGLADPQRELDAPRLAAQWYFEAARQGHADAQYALGILFLAGSGVQQNAREARRWFERAAARGHADAAAFLKGQRR